MRGTTRRFSGCARPTSATRSPRTVPRFAAQRGEKVLYAGLRAGIDLPYECATGTCGTCKAKAVAGSVHDGWPAAPGKKFVKPAAGEFLMCQCAAEEPLTLEVSKFVYAM